MTSRPFGLSKQLKGHEQDVRAVCFWKQQFICTASRDRSVRVWNATTGELLKTLYGHENFVGAVTGIVGSSHFPDSIASGGNDKSIIVWDVEQGNPMFVLSGHTAAVCALGLTRDGELLSASWDNTARVWRGAECRAVLSGHTQAVWAVLGLPDGRIVTGAADQHVRIWRGSVSEAPLHGHRDVVRALQLLPHNVGFASASNDGTVIAWSVAGEQLSSLLAHTAFIYTLAADVDANLLFSGSEDHQLKVWNSAGVLTGGECEQSIAHPGSVWSVAYEPTLGLLVSGCSDGVGRVWSRDPAQAADSEQQRDYEARLASQTISPEAAGGPGGDLGDLSVDKLPGPEALQTPGTKPGEIRMIRRGKAADAYQWAVEQSEWVKVGEVVDASAQAHKQLVNGVSYDYVFDVDLGDGRGMRKLGYNNVDNPWMVAQQFLLREELDQGFLDTVAQHIINNAKPVTIGPDSNAARGDPLTGAHRYVPGGGPAAAAAAAAGPAPQPSAGHFPVRGYALLDAGQPAKILAKANEFQSALSASGGCGDAAWSAAEQAAVAALCQVLLATSTYHVSQLPVDGFRALVKAATTWPAANQFPAWDLLRLTAVHPASPPLFAGWLSAAGVPAVLDVAFASDGNVNNQMLALRLFCNLCKWPAVQPLLLQQVEPILGRAADCVSSASKPLRSALSSLLVNYALLLSSSQQQNNAGGTAVGDARLQLLSIINFLLDSGETEPENVYRAAVALGTVVDGDPAAIEFAKELELWRKFEPWSNSSEARVVATVEQLKVSVFKKR